ncbi:MAG: tRNA glutamyl-Q(34) synthetase GluQRS [Hyphomicrobiales bacterium]
MSVPVFRFAPSPNGRLHLGHAYSALLNEELARKAGGRFLVRMEDIDSERCTPENCAACLEDLKWLGLAFEEPVLFQSTRMAAYRTAMARLMELGLLYVCTCSRQQVAATAGAARDPDGQPLYAGTCRRVARVFNRDSALRLDMAKAFAMATAAGPLSGIEAGERIALDPRPWGDVILARKAIGTSYHLSVVVDDADQGVTDVVRGEDLKQATAIHRLLQVLLGLPEPRYLHHGLLRHDSGRKLAKSKGDESLADLRAAVITADAIRESLGFGPAPRP